MLLPQFRFSLVAVLATSALAQTPVYVPDSSSVSGPVNNIPLGAKGPSGSFQNIRTQIIVPASSLPTAGSTIQEIALAGADDGSYTYTHLEVQLAHLAGAAISSEFASNLAGPKTVLSTSAARVAIQQDQWSPLGLTQRFDHDGSRDLVVDITIENAFFSGAVPGTHRSSTLPIVYVTNYDRNNPKPTGFGPVNAGAKLCLTLADGGSVVVGQPCAFASGQTPHIGSAGQPALTKTFTVTLDDGNSDGTATLILGRSDRQLPPFGLPLDLEPFGAPGCQLFTDLWITLSAPTGASGNAAMPLPIPDDARLVGTRLWFQWVLPAPQTNALALVLSDALQVTLR